MRYVRVVVCLIASVIVSFLLHSLSREAYIYFVATSETAALPWYISVIAAGVPIVLGLVCSYTSLDSWAAFGRALLRLLIGAIICLCVIAVILIVLIIIDIIQHIASDPFSSAIAIILCVAALIPPGVIICVVVKNV